MTSILQSRRPAVKVFHVTETAGQYQKDRKGGFACELEDDTGLSSSCRRQLPNIFVHQEDHLRVCSTGEGDVEARGLPEGRCFHMALSQSIKLQAPQQSRFESLEGFASHVSRSTYKIRFLSTTSLARV